MALERLREARAQEQSAADFNKLPSSWTADQSTIWRLKFIEATLDLKGGDTEDVAIDPRVGIQRPRIAGHQDETTLKIKKWLSPLGTGATGAAPTTELGWMLEKAWGGVSRSTGTTISGTSSTADGWNVTSVAGIAIGDHVITADTISSLATYRMVRALARDTVPVPDTLGVVPALSTAPTTAGVVVYGTSTHYFTTAATFMSFLVVGADSYDQYELTGCTLAKCTFGDLAPGQKPWIEFEFKVNRWRRPSTAAQIAADGFGTAAFSDVRPVVNGGSGLWMADVTDDSPATPSTAATRYQEDAFSVEVDLRTAWDKSLTGAQALGGNQGATRDGIQVHGSMTLLHDYAWQAWYLAKTGSKWIARDFGGATPGAWLRLAIPRAYPDMPPKRVKMKGGKTGDEVSFIGNEGATDTELRRAPLLLVLG